MVNLSFLDAFLYSDYATGLPLEVKSDAEVITEHKVLLHVDDIVAVAPIFLVQQFQDAELHLGLVVEPVHNDNVMHMNNNMIIMSINMYTYIG